MIEQKICLNDIITKLGLSGYGKLNKPYNIIVSQGQQKASRFFPVS